MPGKPDRIETGPIAPATSSIALRVAVEHLAVKPGFRHADPVVAAGHGCEVADEDEGRARSKRVAQKGENAVLRVAAVDPLETGAVAVALEEGRLGAVEPVQIGDEPLQLRVGFAV